MINDINGLRKKQLFDNYGMSAYGGGQVAQDDPYSRGVPQPLSAPYPQPPSEVPITDVLQNIGQQEPAPQAPPPQDPRIMDIINTQYKPRTEATERFKQLIDSAPEMNDPSITRRIVASGMGQGENGLEQMEKVLHMPYINQKDVYKGKIDPAYQAASLENTSNTNERQLAGNVATAELNQRKLEEQNRAAIARQEGVNKKTENDYNIAQEKNRIAWAVQNGAEVDLKGATAIVTYKDGRVVNTGIPTTAFSPIEIANLNNASRERVANIQGATARDVATTRGQATVDAAGARGGGNDIPSHEADRRDNVLQEFYDGPYRDLITAPTTTNGHFQIAERPGGPWMGDGTTPAQDRYDAFLAEYNKKMGRAANTPAAKQEAPPTEQPASPKVEDHPFFKETGGGSTYSKTNPVPYNPQQIHPSMPTGGFKPSTGTRSGKVLAPDPNAPAEKIAVMNPKTDEHGKVPKSELKGFLADNPDWRVE